MKKTFEQWEIEKNLFAVDLSRWNSSKQMTEEEFISISTANLGEFIGVNYKDRVVFLKGNGHEVNRENLINNLLSAKPVEE